MEDPPRNRPARRAPVASRGGASSDVPEPPPGVERATPSGSLASGSSTMTLVGARVGHIRLESELGRGGMGEVYRGFDETLERVVAVKTIRAEHRLAGSARARFLREARILSKLADPAICQVYDLIETEEVELLVLEFVEGETLDKL